MEVHSDGIAAGRLERSCRSHIRIGASGFGIERAAAFFSGRAFAPHRHDRYAIGITLTGVQTFRYRGVERHCLPGQLHVLHPDEMHDGAPGGEEGFGYRIAYVDPALVGECLGGSLPFVTDPVVATTPDLHALAEAISETDQPIDEMAASDIGTVIADGLAAMETGRRRVTGRVDSAGLRRVRAYLAANPEEQTPMARLESLSGLDRWSLARQFRSAFGTSPGRFRTMRRLDRVRSLIGEGVLLADAALVAGFADQSHMSRQFKRAYGMTPGRWVAAIGEGRRQT